MRDLRIADLPDTVRMFPLPGAVLLPGGKLPLNVFEPRYQVLLDDSLAGDRLIGMIQPQEVLEEGRAPIGSDAPLFSVGCLGRISSFSEREDGTAAITLSGVARFRTLRELGSDTPYRVFSVSYETFEEDLERPDAVAFDRAALVAALRRYFLHRGFEARWDAIDQMDDETLLITLGMICPFPPAEKQAILESPTLPERAHILLALLEMAGHENEEDGQHSA